MRFNKEQNLLFSVLFIGNFWGTKEALSKQYSH